MSHPLYQAPQDSPEREEAPQPRGVRARFVGLARQPYFTYALIAINILIFLLSSINPDFYNEALLYPGISYTRGIVEGKEFYRLFTAMFLHANLTHVLMNMLALYSIGRFVEQFFGHWRFLLIYVLGGLLGSVLMLFVSEYGLGASGAVFAIFGAQIVFLYQHRQIFGAAGQAAMRNAIIVMAMNFFIGIAANIGAELTGGSAIIGNAAHIGGAVGGAVLTWFIGPIFQPKQVENPNTQEATVVIDQTRRLADGIIPVLVYLIVLVLILYTAIRFLA